MARRDERHGVMTSHARDGAFQTSDGSTILEQEGRSLRGFFLKNKYLLIS